MTHDVQLAPVDTGRSYRLSQVDEIYQVVANGRAYDYQTINQQVTTVLNKDKEADGTERSDNQASDGNEQEVLYTLVKPLDANTCKDDGETENVEQRGLLMDAWDIFAEKPHSNVAKQTEDDTQQCNLYRRTVTQCLVTTALGYLADSIQGNAQAGQQHDIADDGVLEVHHADTFGLQHACCIGEGHDGEDQSRYRVDVV